MPRILALGPIFALLFTASPAAGQSETGAFRLHKFAQAIGEETYTITRTRTGLALRADFHFSDRGRAVPLTATLAGASDYTPRSFRISGNTSRFSAIDDEVTVSGRRAHVRDGDGA